MVLFFIGDRASAMTPPLLSLDVLIEKTYDARHQAWAHRVFQKGYTRSCDTTSGPTVLTTDEPTTFGACFRAANNKGAAFDWYDGQCRITDDPACNQGAKGAPH